MVLQDSRQIDHVLRHPGPLLPCSCFRLLYKLDIRYMSVLCPRRLPGLEVLHLCLVSPVLRLFQVLAHPSKLRHLWAVP